MKIQIERSGGFSGVMRSIKLDTKNLPKNMADTLECYLSRESIINKKRLNKVSKSPADYYCYKISSTKGKTKRELEFTELDVDNELKTAVNYIFRNFIKYQSS